MIVNMASILLEREDARFLLVDNIKYGDVRTGPAGGKVEPPETVRVCAHREIREELGVLIRIVHELGVYEAPSPEGTFMSRIYIAEIVEGVPEIQPGERRKLRGFDWYNLREMRALHLQTGQVNANLVSAFDDLDDYLTS